ncbi:hypothetical protein [Pseudomonas paraeruginosa]|uniref:hypothetical protein n=1 Tax=Pseudomonas paraeruginosa TaxID=2994495 RepID=UPI0039FC707C
MNDRELLELAAKAAGLKAKWFKVKKWKEYGNSRMLIGYHDVFGTHHSRPWDPLNNDGEALRLAVAVGVFDSIMSYGKFLSWLEDAQEVIDDGTSAFRRAITCYAAEIGRTMP